MRTESETAFFLIGMVLILLIWMVLVVFFYIAYFRMNEILESLSKSPAVMYRRSSLSKDPISRLLLLNCVSAILMFPRRSLKCGDLNIHDYECFPVGLKFVIRVSGCSMLVLGLASIILVVIGKLNGWLV